MQWHDRGGRFRHVALHVSGVRRMLGVIGVIALLILGVAGIAGVASGRALAYSGNEGVRREGRALVARQAALRQQMLELAWQLHDRFGDERCTRPPARDAGEDELLAWISEHLLRLDTLEEWRLFDGAVKRTSSVRPADGLRTASVSWAASGEGMCPSR